MILAGAVLGALLSAMVAIVDNPKADMFQMVDDSLAHLEAGLPPDWAPGKRR